MWSRLWSCKSIVCVVACKCHPHGSASVSCSESGVCDCHPNVIGVKCDSCLDQYHGLHTGIALWLYVALFSSDFDLLSPIDTLIYFLSTGNTCSHLCHHLVPFMTKDHVTFHAWIPQNKMINRTEVSLRTIPISQSVVSLFPIYWVSKSALFCHCSFFTHSTFPAHQVYFIYLIIYKTNYQK